MYRIFTTKEFDNDFKNLDKSIQKRIEKELRQLHENPYVGKPLSYKFFREKKVEKYRFYYLIYEEFISVFAIAISGKKDQQSTIDKTKLLIPHYRQEIKKKLNL